MSVIQAIILGAIQGLTEFLPISSSGHLVLIPYFFNWLHYGLAFDVALHGGTAIALLLYFWKDWLAILKNAFTRQSTIKSPLERGGRAARTGCVNEAIEEGAKIQSDSFKQYPNNFLWQILVASIPAGIIGLALDKIIENKFEKDYRFVLFIAFNLAVFGFILWYVDNKAKSHLSPGALTYKKALLVGLFQSIALIPGVSRSGITITAARLVGLKREAAARFSFLISTPVIIGAFLVKLPDMLKEGIDPAFWLGIAAAAIFGLIAIKFLLAYLKKSDFSLFLWYRLALAALVVIVFFVRF